MVRHADAVWLLSPANGGNSTDSASSSWNAGWEKNRERALANASDNVSKALISLCFLSTFLFKNC